ncbi:hypothetical protein TIFTF001_027843 [Ficus carica]|uniref:Uncharacterized protein n=1 Tax=Ficus carica TaxID=3494 RepID=A0AA88J0A1_FICCA|nr:hypothetical protein TIFTF001_027843 [Ficus carica]
MSTINRENFGPKIHVVRLVIRVEGGGNPAGRIDCLGWICALWARDKLLGLRAGIAGLRSTAQKSRGLDLQLDSRAWITRA